MKLIMAIIYIFISITSVIAQSITVQSDKKLNTDFDKYNTFYWASQVDSQLDDGYYFLNDLVLKAGVRDAVKAELMGLGYELDPSSPDLIVNFRVFEKPTRLKGTEGYGSSYWGTNRRYRSNPILLLMKWKQEPYW